MAEQTGEEREVERARTRREDRAEQTYRIFLKGLKAKVALSDEVAERAAVEVLTCLGERILPSEMKDLEAQLPLKLQNLLSQFGGPRQLKPHHFTREVFLERVASALGMSPSEVEPIIRAVFATVQEHVSEGELEDVRAELPLDWADLWREN